MHLITAAGRSGDAGRRRAAVEAVAGVAAAAVVGSARPAPSSWWPSSCPPAGVATTHGSAGRRRSWPPRSGPRPAVPLAAVLTGPATCRPTSGTTPRSTARPSARWAGRVLSGQRGGRLVKVLVTGASGMLGLGHRPGAGRPRGPGHRAAAPPGRARAARGAGRRRRPGRGPAGRRRAGRRGPSRRQGQHHRRVAGLPAGQHRRAPRPSSTPAGPPACARLVHVSSPSVAHAGESLVGVGGRSRRSGPAPGGRTRGARRARSSWRWRRTAAGLAVVGDPPAPGLGAGRPPAGRAGWWTAPGPAGCSLVGSGAALIDTTYVDNAVDALVAALDRCAAAHGQALVVSNGEPRPVAELFDCDLRRRRSARAAAAGCRSGWRTRPGWRRRGSGPSGPGCGRGRMIRR